MPSKVWIIGLEPALDISMTAEDVSGLHATAPPSVAAAEMASVLLSTMLAGITVVEVWVEPWKSTTSMPEPDNGCC